MKEMFCSRLIPSLFFYNETWRSLVGLNISFNFYFVSKLSTNEGSFLIWINISELCAVPDVD